jgi:hypothetical protein
MNVQIKCYDGKVKFFDNLQDGFEYAKEEELKGFPIYSIIFDINGIEYKWIIKIPNETWSENVEFKLETLNTDYLEKKDVENFWIFYDAHYIINFELQIKSIIKQFPNLKNPIESAKLLESIRMVFTTKQFQEFFQLN